MSTTATRCLFSLFLLPPLVSPSHPPASPRLQAGCELEAEDATPMAWRSSKSKQEAAQPTMKPNDRYSARSLLQRNDRADCFLPFLRFFPPWLLSDDSTPWAWRGRGDRTLRKRKREIFYEAVLSVLGRLPDLDKERFVAPKPALEAVLRSVSFALTHLLISYRISSSQIPLLRPPSDENDCDEAGCVDTPAAWSRTVKTQPAQPVVPASVTEPLDPANEGKWAVFHATPSYCSHCFHLLETPNQPRNCHNLTRISTPGELSRVYLYCTAFIC